MTMKMRFVAACIVAALLFTTISTASADEGWQLSRFDADYTVQQDGTLAVHETIDADFGQQQHHGIVRYLYTERGCGSLPSDSEAPVVECPNGASRVYNISAISVTGAGGTPIPVSESREGDSIVLKIGDPDTLVSGKQTYDISYNVSGAFVAYPSHDELYWDVLGSWPVQASDVHLALHLPTGANLQVVCYQGASGSDEPCDASASGADAAFNTTRPLSEGQGMTIAAAWQPGLVTIPPPRFDNPKTLRDYFTFDAIELAATAAVAVLCIVLLIAAWWRHGRDRRYKSLYYLTNDPRQGTKPLFAHTDIVVEYTPPDDLRPAEMGVILDERADTLDVTATIVDLAVRGYLHITEIPKDGRFGKADWKLTRQKPDDDELQTYEQTLLDGLFHDGDEVRMSDLKNTFVERLNRVKSSLYSDAMRRKWFSSRPEKTRQWWMVAGFVIAAIGAIVSVAMGYFFGRALIFTPIAIAGILLAALSSVMPRRTATGSEALRRVLGFRLYIATAETRRQQFNEQQNIFARYLPFAIVFGCVTKWAKAFEGLDDAAQQSTASWYTSTTPFQVAAFSAGLQGFSSSVSSTISSSPASSGGSGFSSGGFAGGGGGGGGGGSW